MDIKEVQYTITVKLYATPSDMHIINNQISEVSEVGVERVGPVSDVVALLREQIYCNAIRSRFTANFISYDLQIQKHHPTPSKNQAGTFGLRLQGQSAQIVLGLQLFGQLREE